MKKHRCSQLVMVLIVWALSMTISFSVYAQKSDLREAPRQQEQKIVPVARKLINVELWMNKDCGSPFYTEEKVQIYFKTDVDGYVTLYDIDTQGNVLVIFPNRHTPDNYVRTGQSFQIPAQQADYDLIVEGPEGIEYIEAMASTDSYYHWNYYDGEPRWLQELNLKGNKGREYEAGGMDQETAVAYRESKEYQTAPEEFGATGVQSLMRNFQISKNLREQVRSKLVVRPREPEQPQQPEVKVEPVSDEQVENYSTATCYMYIVDRTAPAPPPPRPPSQEDYLLQQEREFQQIPGLAMQRRENRLLLELPGSTLFTSGSSSLYYEARQDLSQVASVLLRYPDTTIVVMGHTDSIGERDHNQRLSEARAKAVADYLMSEGVAHHRINWIGYGETMPIASNSTEAGRQRNRRVELEIRYEQ